MGERGLDLLTDVVGQPIECAGVLQLLVELAVVGREIRLEAVVDDEAVVPVAEGALLALGEALQRERLCEMASSATDGS